MKVLKILSEVLRVIEKLIMAWGIIFLAFNTVGNVISRKFFNYSWSFSEEVSQFLIVIITYMGIGYAARSGRHIRMSAIFEMMSEKMQKMMMLLVHLVTLVVLFYLSYHATVFVLEAQAVGRVTPVLRIPFYFAIMWVPFGLFLGGIQFALAFIKNIKEKDVWLSFEAKSEFQEF